MRGRHAVLVVVVASAVWWLCRDDGALVPVPSPDAALIPAPAARSGHDQPPAAAAPAANIDTNAPRSDATVAADGSWHLAVVVVDAFGEPVEDAAVELRDAVAAAPQTTGTTDGAGIWRGPVRDETVFVRASHALAGTSVLLPIPRAHAGNGEPRRLVLGDPVRVRCLVLDDAVRPVAAATVTIVATGGNGTDAYTTQVATSTLRTDAAGRCELEVLPGTRLRCSVDEPRVQAAVHHEVTAACELTLVPPGAFRIDGSTVDAFGRPVPTGLGDARFSGAPFVTTLFEELSPTFAVVVPGAGTHVLRFAAPGYTTPPVTVELTLQEPRRTLTVVMTRALPTRGRVVDANDRPLAGVIVAAEPIDERWGARTAASGDDGTFVVELPEGTRWRLGTDGEPTTVPCTAGDADVRLVVRARAWAADGAAGPAEAGSASPDGQVELEVHTADGRPAVYPWLQWLRQDATRVVRENTSATSDGPRFSLAAPDVARVLGVIDAVTGQSTWVRVERAGGRQRVVLQPPALVRVHVRRGAGVPRGVEVVVDPHGMMQRERLGRSGRVTFAGVGHGPAVISVVRGGAVLARQTTELRAGITHDVHVELPH